MTPMHFRNRPNRPEPTEADLLPPTLEEIEQERHYFAMLAEAERMAFEGWVKAMEEAFGDIDLPPF